MARKQHKTAHRIGPYSKDSGLAKLDHRTREGKFVLAIEAELRRHLGGSPSVPQQLLAKLASIKALRISLMVPLVLTEASISERNDREFLAWANSFRRDLETLGLDPIPESAPTLRQILGGKSVVSG